MIDRKEFPSLRIELAVALYDAAGCEAWPWCTDPHGCFDLYLLLEKVGLNVTRESAGRVEYVYPSIAPFEVSPVLDVIFQMTEYGRLQYPNIFDGYLEIPFEIGELLERNSGEWRKKLDKIAEGVAHTASQKISVIEFVYELLEIALPDSYLAQESVPYDSFDEDSEDTEDHFTSDTSFDDPEFEVFQDPGVLNVEERIVLIDRLWVPEWSASIPKSSRRVIGLILAAIDGRPYAKSFVPNIDPGDRHAVGWPIEIAKAFGVTEAEAKVSIYGAWEIVNDSLNDDFTAPFYFNT
jgi:hypothetical protein